MTNRRREGTLMWPSEWSAPASGRNIAFLCFFLLLLVGLSSVGVAALLDGDSRAVIMLFGGILMIPVLPFLFLTRLGIRRRSTSAVVCNYDKETRGQAVRIPYSAPTVAMYWLLGALTFVFFAFVTLGAVLSLPYGTAFPGPVLLLGVGLAGSGYMLWFIIHGVQGKLARGVVALTPEGVYHRSWAFRSYVPWDGVLLVGAAESDGPAIMVLVTPDSGSWHERTSRLWKQEEMSLEPSLVVRGRWLSVDPALLYHTLRYYHAHPELRTELGTEAGARRVRDGKVVV